MDDKNESTELVPSPGFEPGGFGSSFWELFPSLGFGGKGGLGLFPWELFPSFGLEGGNGVGFGLSHRFALFFLGSSGALGSAGFGGAVGFGGSGSLGG